VLVLSDGAIVHLAVGMQRRAGELTQNLPQIRGKVRLQCMVVQLQRATTHAGLLCAPDKYC